LQSPSGTLTSSDRRIGRVELYPRRISKNILVEVTLIENATYVNLSNSVYDPSLLKFLPKTVRCLDASQNALQIEGVITLTLLGPTSA
jgi:hypothetical protein